MARFDARNIDNYGSKSGGSFFSLKNDKDTAQVRFLYNGVDDIEGFSVHRVKVGDREKYVNCLRDYNSPIDDCPLCKSRQFPVQAKIFVPLYNEDVGEIQMWERGKTFYSQISGLCSRYPNTVSQVFDVERNGKPRDTSTTYNFYPVGSPDGTKVQDILDDLGLDSVPTPLGSMVLDKTADEMEYYLTHGDFSSTTTAEAPIRRRGTADNNSNPPWDNSNSRESGRSSRVRGDRF